MEKVELGDKEFMISAKFTGDVEGFPFDDGRDRMMHNRFRVRVTRNVSGEKITRSFQFYGSAADWGKGETKLEGTDLLCAFRAFLEDSASGAENFEEFCGEYGYDTDSRNAERIWRECKKSTKKLLDLGVYESETCDLINALSDKGIE